MHDPDNVTLGVPVVTCWLLVVDVVKAA